MAELPSADDLLGPKPTADTLLGPAPETFQPNLSAYSATMDGPAWDAAASAGSLGRVLDAFGAGAKQGWGAEPLGLSEESQDWLRKAGVFNDYKEGHTTFLKTLNEGLIRPAAAALTLPFRALSSVFGGAEAAAAQAGTEVGQPALGRDVAAMLESGGGLLGSPGTLPHTVAEARSLKVIGPEGEAGWKGTAPATEAPTGAEAMRETVAQAPEEAQSLTAPESAVETTPEAGPAAPAPDIHAAVRQARPSLFNEYDTLREQHALLSARLYDLRQGGEVHDLESQIDALRGQRLEAPASQRADLANRITGLEAERDRLDQHLKSGGTTPLIEQTSQAVQALDYRMRDLAPAVSEAYRDAQEGRVSPEAAEIAPEPAPVAEAAPAATPAPEPEQAAPAPPQAPAETAPAEPTAPIAQDIARQLVAAGRPQEEAAAAAELVAAHYQARAANLRGVTAEGLYREEAPKVVAGRGAQRQMEFAQPGELGQSEAPKTAAFRKWFGESKAVDKNGEPLRLFHGTDVDFTTFDKGKVNSRFPYSIGLHFTDRPEEASVYAEGGDISNLATGWNPDSPFAKPVNEGGRVMPVYVKAENPLVIKTDQLTASMEADLNRADIIHKLVQAKRAGHAYDSVIIQRARGDAYDGRNVIVFDPRQIKSAVGNTGAFGESDDILEQPRRGQIKLADPETAARATITLFKDADASTFIHETGHQWLEELTRDAADERATDQVRTDAATVRDWLGVKEGEAIPRRAHERFARGFERYMMEGHAPSQALANVFAKFKGWLTQIYEKVNRLRAPINDDIRDVFNRMLSHPELERNVIAPEREADFASRHEVLAEHTEPHEAAAVADQVRGEIDAIAREKAPELADELGSGERGTAAGGEPAADGDLAGGADAARPVSGPEGPTGDVGTLTASRNAIAEENGRAPSSTATAAKPITGSSTLPATGDRLVDKAGNIRLDNINTAEDFKRALRDAAERNDNYLERRRGVVSDAQRLALADVLGTTPDKVFGRGVGEAFTDSEIKLLERTLAQSAAGLRELGAQAAAGSDADVVAFTEAMLRHDMVQGLYSQATAEAGRALRALKKSQEFWTSEAKATNELVAASVSDATGRTLFQMRKLASQIANLETPGQVSKLVRDANTPGLFDWLQSLFINALLSGPFTHAGYTVAGQMYGLFRSLGEAPLAALVGAVRRGFSLGDAQDAAHIGEASAQLYGQFRGMRNGVKAAWQALKENRTVLPAEVEAQQGDLFGGAVQSQTTIPNPRIGGVTIPLGTTLESPGRLVAALHSFNWTTFYSQSISAQAFRIAMHEGLDGDAFTQRVAALTISPTEEMIAEASTDASGGALVTRPAYDSVMGMVSRLTNKGFELPDVPLPGGRSLPLGTLRPIKFIDPFVQIQANVLKAAFGRGTPVALFRQDVRDDLMMRNGAAAFDRTAGKLLAGTGLMVAAGGMAAEGLLSDSGPTNPREAMAWRRIHGMPHGLKVGHLTFDILRLGNLGLQMSIAADLWHVAAQATSEDLSAVASSLVHAVSQNILDESFARGPAEMMQAVEDSDRYGAKWIRNFAASMIPFSVGLGQVAREIDPYSRDARTLMDAIKAKLPGVSETLPARYDVWGRPVPSWGWAVTYYSSAPVDPVDQKLYALGVYPSLPERRIRGVALTEEQYAEFCRTAGRMAKMRVDQIVGQPAFDQMPKGIQIELVDKAMHSARQTASGLLLMKHPSIMDAAVAAKKSEVQGVKRPAGGWPQTVH